MNRTQQTQFIRAALDPNRPVPSIIANVHHERFKVYQNNVIASLVDSLYDSLPSLVSLLGATYFRAVAKEFVHFHPPRSPLMAEYGAELPGFLEAFAPLAEMPYLADVARIELARIASFHAADAPTLGADEFAGFNPEQLASASFALHPSLRLVASNYPVFRLWHSQLYNSSLPDPKDWHGEQVMCLRRNNDVTTLRLQSGCVAFFNALLDGKKLIEAWSDASKAGSAFNLTDALSLMIHEQLTVRIIS